MNAEKISDLLIDARKEFKEQHQQDALHWPARSKCVGCTTEDVPTAQQWNDVGGERTRICEACWIICIVAFWAHEEEAVDEHELMNEAEKNT